MSKQPLTKESAKHIFTQALAQKLHSYVKTGEFFKLTQLLHRPRIEDKQLLIDALNTPNDEGNTCLHVAAQRGDIATYRTLLASGADATLRNSLTGETPGHILAPKFHACITHGDAIALSRILEVLNADEQGRQTLAYALHAPGNEGSTCLHIALQHKEFDIYRTLLEYGADATQYDLSSRKTPEYILATHIHTWIETQNVPELSEALKALRASEKGQEALAKTLNKPISPRHMTSLHIAAQTQDIATYVTLLEHGADATLQNRAKQTPAHLFAAQISPCIAIGDLSEFSKIAQEFSKLKDGNQALVDILNTPDSEGNTCLHLAAQRGNIAMCNLLIKCGAGTAIRNNLGNTALYEAAICPTLPADTPQWQGSDIHATQHNDGNPLLHYAAYTNNTQACVNLIKLGLSATQADHAGNTALTCATIANLTLRWVDKRKSLEPIASKFSPIVEDLRTGCLSTTFFKPRSTSDALHIAAYLGNAPLVSLLCTLGADVNRLDKYGRTPLHYIYLSSITTEQEKNEVLQLLCERGANENQQDLHGKTAMDYAATAKNPHWTDVVSTPQPSPSRARHR